MFITYSPCRSPRRARFHALYSITEPEMPLTRVNSGSASCACGVRGRRAEIVAQAQRVAGLVHHHVLDVRGDEALDVRAVRRELAARLEQRQAEHRFAGGAVAVLAVGAVGRRQHRRRAAGRGRHGLGAQVAHRAHVHRVDADVGVEDLAGARVDHRHADRAERRLRHRLPAHRRMPDVGGVEVGVVGLDLDLQRILVADALERLVPLQDAGAHRLAVGERNVAVQPEHDRLLRLRQRARPDPSSPAASA